MMDIDFKFYLFVVECYFVYLLECDGGIDMCWYCVVIVGGGFVGFVVVFGFVNYGICSVLIEVDDLVCYGSCVICILCCSFEIVEWFGVFDDFLCMGLLWIGGCSFYWCDEVLYFMML